MEEPKRRVVAAFDLASTTYDEPTLRFFDVHAPALVRKAQIHEGARVLDVATGTGKVALEAARLVGPNGRVIGIDLSGGMLAQACRKTGRLPEEFRRMDAETLEFEDAAFDSVLCGFGNLLPAGHRSWSPGDASSPAAGRASGVLNVDDAVL
jgi:ubiquinone/menaquinone biosynthesis C-methylase UbiE